MTPILLVSFINQFVVDIVRLIKKTRKRSVRVKPAHKLAIMLGDGGCPWVLAFWVRNRLITETAGIPRHGPILENVADISRL
ncbi:hypothetical protein A9Q96_04470 [Rhodobacterales bacterium 52_120_T64]|nr:hypothetical protein A9Q96_04470 [Rhodobacterales bacterium 52_120_T64]